FFNLGRRGPEFSSLESFAYARSLGGERYDVKRWNSAFFTDGKKYMFQYPGKHDIFSTCQDVEAVNAVVESGVRGSMAATLPIYSSLAFLYRGELAGPDFGLELLTDGLDSPLRTVEIKVGDTFPSGRALKGIWGRREQIMFILKREGDVLTGSPGLHGIVEEEVFEPRALRTLQQSGFDPELDKDYPVTYVSPKHYVAAHTIFAELASRSNLFYNSIVRMERPTENVELFVLANEPATFKLSDSELERQSGTVLYHFVLRE
ncbi:MAG: hypothetical protein AAF492_24455, partial [Verrucomicrobiota bacterium]